MKYRNFVTVAREGFWIEKYGVLGEGGMNRRSWEGFWHELGSSRVGARKEQGRSTAGEGEQLKRKEQ